MIYFIVVNKGDANMTEAIAAIIGAVVGGLFVIAAVFIQKGKKVITYEVLFMPLLRFKPLDNTLTISVDKSVLTGNQAEKGMFEPINNAYGFQIKLLNVGNEDIEKPNIEIELDKEAKIISCETQPSSRPGYDINIQKDPSRSNILRILVPFINKKETALLRIISTGNKNKKCKVTVLGFGIKYHEAKPQIYPLIVATVLVPLSLLLLILVFALPASFWLSLGGSYSTPSSTIIPPFWYFTLLAGIYIIGLGMTSLYLLRRFKARRAMLWKNDDT